MLSSGVEGEKMPPLFFSASTADAKGVPVWGICLDKMRGGHDKVSVPDDLGWERVAIVADRIQKRLINILDTFLLKCAVNLKS